jgi:hypothetical protein
MEKDRKQRERERGEEREPKKYTSFVLEREFSVCERDTRLCLSDEESFMTVEGQSCSFRVCQRTKSLPP